MPDHAIERIFAIIGQTPQHRFLILTKRAERMARFFESRAVPDNCWIGLTVENRQHGYPRLKYLQQINAKNRWIVCEPLLDNLYDIDLRGIHYVVGGGESGPNGRPALKKWVLTLRDRCKEADVPFCWKQWGRHDENGIIRENTGSLIDGKKYHAVPEGLTRRVHKLRSLF